MPTLGPTMAERGAIPPNLASMTPPLPPPSGAWRRLAKPALYGIARTVGFVSLLRWVYRRRVAILCYHSIVDRSLPPWVAAGGLHLPVGRFRQQMAFLARHYRVIPLDDLVEHRGQGIGRLPAPAVALTFDDGYANNLSLAAPILAALGFPATIFLPTAYIGREGLYWWDELAVLLSAALGRRMRVAGWGRLDLTTTRTVRAAFGLGNRLLASASLTERQDLLAALRGAIGHVAVGPWEELLRPALWEECRAAPVNIRFGGHGASHRLLGAIPIADARTDLECCAQTLRTELGRRASAVFCYPGGGSTPAVRASLPMAGFTAAVTASASASQEGLVSMESERTLLVRIGVSADTTLQAFAVHLSGLRRLLALPAG
ncbi:MAG: hypothetical protein DMD41_15775 [Gemmatimonadetes bacterium]|nr:MAG: hypothetical protein DMD41_15775 [Gemmatimonadota bacterium]